jgi:hypothetical protein
VSASDWLDDDEHAAMAQAWAEREAAKASARKTSTRLAARASLSRIPADWLDAALPEPCAVYLAETGGVCGRRPTRLYLTGRRCWTHAPDTPTRKDGPRG